MSRHSTEQSVLFQGISSKPIVVRFDTEGQSSDGGLLLLKALDEGIGLTAKLGSHLIDDRDPDRIVHSQLDLLRQRICGLAAGYEDCNDAERVRADPCMKIACDRDPLDSEADLGSQPTLSRFENSQDRRAILGMQRELEVHVIERLAKTHRHAKLVTVDLDPSCDPTHGQQQFSLFHGKYDTWCYLPQYGFLSIDDEPRQYLFHARLRPGNARCHRGAIPVLRRIVPQIREAFPGAKVRVRLDGGFASPAVFEALEELRVEYLVAFARNSVLAEAAEPMMELARGFSAASGETETLYGEVPHYMANSWTRCRRVVIKAEVVRLRGREPKDNARFVVTNLSEAPKEAYELYCERGDAENRIKEMQALQSDRTSCGRFLANQLRLTMTAAAYVLFQELGWRIRRTEAGRAQVSRLQLMLVKIGTCVTESVRRIVLHFSHSHPWKELWWSVARAVGATIG